jgi:hypothetical protein
MHRFSPFALVFPLAALVHCSGSSTTDVGADAAAGVDGSTDGAATGDSTTGDDSSSSDGSTTGDDAQADTATGDDGPTPDAAACGATGTTRAACVTCCATAHPQGAESLASDELACACTPDDCGPLDGGTATDAGDLGTGACTAECAAPSHDPGATCDTCLRRSVGSMTTHGPCYTQVTTACEADTACKAYATCELTCPAN